MNSNFITMESSGGDNNNFDDDDDKEGDCRASPALHDCAWCGAKKDLYRYNYTAPVVAVN